MGENSVETIATPPPSLYAVSTFLALSLTFIHILPHTSYFLDTDLKQFQSLEPRPRSIYDVLDHSGAKTEPVSCKDKPKKNKSPKMVSTTLIISVFFCFFFKLNFIHSLSYPAPHNTFFLFTGKRNQTTPARRHVRISLWKLLSEG